MTGLILYILSVKKNDLIYKLIRANWKGFFFTKNLPNQFWNFLIYKYIIPKFAKEGTELLILTICLPLSAVLSIILFLFFDTEFLPRDKFEFIFVSSVFHFGVLALIYFARHKQIELESKTSDQEKESI